KLTVLEQYGKGLVQCEAVLGEGIREKIARLKWSLWHGQVDKALGKVDDLVSAIAPFNGTYARFEFIPIKSWVTKGSGAPGNCAVRNRAPSRDHGCPPSTGGSGLSQSDSASHCC